MTTTLHECAIELSKQIGDYWSSTTTGAGSSTTLVDTAMMAKANDWITDEAYAFLVEEPAGAAAIYDERKASTLNNTTGTLTTLAFGAAPGTGIDYEVHRLFSPSDKRIALIAAARRIFPYCFTRIWNEEMVSGNWLKDGSFERWKTSTDLTDWTETTVTVTQTTTAGYIRQGATSCKLSGSSGTLVQGWIAGTAEFEDLRNLRGKSATFTAQGWCDTVDSLRMSINDGTTQTYSDYHDGDSAWTEDNPRNDNFYVTQYIDPNATQVTLTFHYTTGATAYIDDARVLSEPRGKLYIGHIGFPQNTPHRIEIEPNYYSNEEPWTMVTDYKVDDGGYLYIPTKYISDRRLRMRGAKILDYLASGVSSTAWTATIDINQPQLEILIAEAALYLYTYMAMPNFESGQRENFQQMIGFWQRERADRIRKYGMKTAPIPVNWGLS